MSQHSRHYLDLYIGPEATPAQAAAPAGAGHYAPSWAIVVLAIALLIVQLLAAAFPDQKLVVTPVRSPVVEHHPLAPLEVDEARIEGYRAGVAAATEAGCSAALSHPIAPR